MHATSTFIWIDHTQNSIPLQFLPRPRAMRPKYNYRCEKYQKLWVRIKQNAFEMLLAYIAAI